MSDFEGEPPSAEQLSFNEIVQLLKKFQQLYAEWSRVNSVHDADDIFVLRMGDPGFGDEYKRVRTELLRCAEQLNVLQDDRKLDGPLAWLRDSDDVDERNIAVALARLQQEDGSFPTFKPKPFRPTQLTEVRPRRRWPWQRK